MTKIDIISGFLGAGKTTLINKLIKEAYGKEKLVLIENEFGDIGIDGGFLQEAGINITEMNSGCICCSLVGDFGDALKKVISEYNPDRVLIEPSGVGKLSDVIKAVNNVKADGVKLNCHAVVVDAGKCKMYMKNFGEFFNDQIEHANCIVFSHTDKAGEAKLLEAVKLVREHNGTARIISTNWNELTADQMLYTMEGAQSIEEELHKLLEHEHHHYHHHDEECDCHEHGHHHHHHDEECDCHEHGHHHHHADEVFTSFGCETAKKFTVEGIQNALETFSEDDSFGMVLRAKGIVEGEDGEWIHFDYVPEEPNVRHGAAGVIGRLCVIGSNLDNDKIKEIFGL